MLDQQLAEELHKPIIRKFGKRKANSHFTNIWDLQSEYFPEQKSLGGTVRV